MITPIRCRYFQDEAIPYRSKSFFSRRKANLDMRWKVQWKDVTVTSNAGSVTSGFSKSKLTEDSMQVLIWNTYFEYAYEFQTIATDSAAKKIIYFS